MTEKKQNSKRMPFAPVRTKRIKKTEFMTDRQKAAYRRQKAESQAQRNEHQSASKGGIRLVKMRPEGMRITQLIVDELTRAFSVILKLDGPADQLMKAFFKSNPKLGGRDRAILAEAIFYGLRHFASISYRMQPMKPSRVPRVAALLTLALQYGREALIDSVVGRENGTLDNTLACNMKAAEPCVMAEMPSWLYDLLLEQYGDAEAWSLMRASNESAPLDIRVNSLKAKREEVLEELASHRLAANPMRFSPDGIRLVDKPGLIRSPMYQEGRIDVQDEGSQLLARLLGAKRGEMVCDFCAGAGGKTLAIGAMMRSSGRLYAFDVNEKRLAGLKPRMRRAGLSNVHPMAIRDEKDLRVKRLRGKFDRVLIDAPCSGTGTLRRNPDLKWRLDLEELNRINGLQTSILEEASRLVKAGGRLVYATCSLLMRENQAIVEAFLEKHSEFELLNATEVLAKQGVELPKDQVERFGDYFIMLPHVHDTDGFFGAVLQRRSE